MGKRSRRMKRDPLKPPLESEVSKQIVDMLNSLPRSMAFKKFTGGMFGRKGVHDILGCFNGIFISIEVKKPGRPLRFSVDQAEWAREVDDAGGITMLVNSVEQVVDNMKMTFPNFPDVRIQ